MPANPASNSLRWSVRLSAISSGVLLSMCRRTAGSAGSRLPLIQLRACWRNSSRSSVSLLTTAILLLETGELAQPLALPIWCPVEHGVGRQAPQEQVLVVLPGEPDATEDLEAVLSELLTAVVDEGLRHGRDLHAVLV